MSKTEVSEVDLYIIAREIHEHDGALLGQGPHVFEQHGDEVVISDVNGAARMSMSKELFEHVRKEYNLPMAMLPSLCGRAD
jgi:hypothetical protein